MKPQIGAEVKVEARISGRVERLHTNIKDQVRKGQVIDELDQADLEAAVAQRRAELRLAEAKLAALTELLAKDVAKGEADVTRYEASVALARKDMARQRDLLRERISSQEATDQVQEKLAVAEAQHDAARKTLELVRAQYAENRKQAQAELDRDRAALTNAEVLLSYDVITARSTRRPALSLCKTIGRTQKGFDDMVCHCGLRERITSACRS